MKRQKRDRSERAFSRGMKAGLSGRQQGLCPYTDPALRSQWLGGWREGHDDRLHSTMMKNH